MFQVRRPIVVPEVHTAVRHAHIANVFTITFLTQIVESADIAGEVVTWISALATGRPQKVILVLFAPLDINRTYVIRSGNRRSPPLVNGKLVISPGASFQLSQNLTVRPKLSLFS